jgi:GNAT superfamily N-acetyltransferase
MDNAKPLRDGPLRVETLIGPAFHEALPALARLRIAVFRDWPYLYAGTFAAEQAYLDRFAATSGSVIVAAFAGSDIVGCATAAPLLGHEPEFAQPFLAAGFQPERIFYFGESVLLPAFRGRGVGHRFFDHREAAARAVADVTHTAFCGVVREPSHPSRPPSYVPLDAFWSKRGYLKAADLVAQYAWVDVGDTEKTSKPMQFWLRALPV